MSGKKCTRCKIVKSLEEFNKMKSSKDGKHYYCKSCTKIISREKYKKNRIQILASVKKYQEKNSKEISRKRKNERAMHGDEIRAKEKISRDRNIESHRASSRNYYHNNKDQVREKRRLREKERYKTDPDFKFRKDSRRRILNALKKQNTFKNGSTVSLLGCSILEARQHIEKSFTDGMSWDNHGEWEVDHILPCASFDLTDLEQQKKCFHYTNLQALWKMDNKLKGAKII